MKIVIGNDHAAVSMKKKIQSYLESKGYEVINVGTDTEERCNYPEIAAAACKKIQNGEAERGVLICGTGAGMAITANKLRGIRAVVCSEPVTARLAREHNHANVICFGERVVGEEMGYAIVDAYLNAQELGDRHAMRVGLISEIEEAESTGK
jgi:ribose 5-phosphate isomerase B